LQSEKAVKLQTVSRSIVTLWDYPKQGPRIRKGWQMTQTSQIRTTQLKAVPLWLESIEEAGALLSGLSYQVSNPVLKETHKLLLQRAVADFRAKAAVLAKSLSVASYRIVHFDTSGSAPRVRRYQPAIAMMVKTSNAVPTALSVGENRITTTVNGEIVLPFKDLPAAP